ncbi:hypothetical protein FBUS_06982 [Fasciolopsis buskii]|uniref:Uncharacterized protein n=1 Tax=Fasciolopsis buskii TaxID=27845 RepID=A0A8E0RYT6_9TREM|nr:hypothetical protein FBUS_06982 [Fasciolopsis buski]
MSTVNSRILHVILLCVVVSEVSFHVWAYPSSGYIEGIYPKQVEDVIANQPLDFQNALREYQNAGGANQAPRIPKIFQSPEALRTYLNKLNEYFITIGRPR